MQTTLLGPSPFPSPLPTLCRPPHPFLICPSGTPWNKVPGSTGIVGVLMPGWVLVISMSLSDTALEASLLFTSRALEQSHLHFCFSKSPWSLLCDYAWAVTTSVIGNRYRYTHHGVLSDHPLMTDWENGITMSPALTHVRQLAHQKWTFSRKAMNLRGRGWREEREGEEWFNYIVMKWNILNSRASCESRGMWIIFP